jgi:hypothetical protein
MIDGRNLVRFTADTGLGRMYSGKLVFTQVLEHVPQHSFRRCVQRYQGNRYVKRFTCQDQFRAMAFAQLSYRESLRDIEACLAAQQSKLYHMGIQGPVARSTLADANEQRDWRIYADLAQTLIRIARALYVDDSFGMDLDQSVYALDATTIDLCLSLFPWAQACRTKGAVKLHTLLDLRGNIPTFIHISDGKLSDVKALDLLVPEPGAFYIMDRGYFDFARLYRLHSGAAFFLIRAKSDTQVRRQYSRAVDRSTGLRCDQTIRPSGKHSPRLYPEQLRRIKYYDAETDKTFVFLTNNFELPALTIAELYRYRWRVELFFKWIKQHLRIKTFFGTSENAVKTQVWIAVGVYVLVAIIKKRLDIPGSLYTMLQILSLTLFERTPLNQLLTGASALDYENHGGEVGKQLNLFD